MFLKQIMGLETLVSNTDYVTAVGEKGLATCYGEAECFCEKVMCVEKHENLAGSGIRVGENLCLKVRNTTGKLMPYLKHANRRGLRAFIKK